MLAGKYRVDRVIGQGGMGVVVEARHIALDDRVALKFLTSTFAQHPEAAARFLREGKAAVKIKSEHVARVSDVGTLENGSPYMVMEYLEGHDLAKELTIKGVLALQDAIDYVIQAAEALSEAHAAGIIHRDIKPANLFLTRRHDGSSLVKVLDFGISKMQESTDNLTKTTAAMGSALYMSPEQMQQTRGVDHRTDIYALGISLYELLAGKQPFYADTLPQLCAEVLTGSPTPLRVARPDLPEPFALALEKAYARDRGARYPTIADFVLAIAPFAPSRSQPNIDRIARAAGLDTVVAGAPPRNPPPQAPIGLGGTIAIDAAPAPHRGGTIALEAPPPARAASTAPSVPPAAGSTAIPPTQPSAQTYPPAPAGQTLPTTAPNMVLATPAVPTSSGKTPLLIAVVALFVLGGAAGAFFALSNKSESAQTASQPLQPTAAASTAAAVQTAAAPTASPATVVSVEPSAATSAAAAPTETASATPAASTKPKVAGSTAPKSTAAPKPTPGKSIFDDR
ncbi:MAG: protein kinase [Polyangiaceae bacterium]|nr:protein kinase [Polyangiaceae bacterium]